MKKEVNVNNCPFCKIVKKEFASYQVSENEYAIAFLDIDPISDGHTLVIPKEHYLDLATTPVEVLKGVFALVQEVALKIERSSLKPWGFNYLSNQGSIAGQVVNHFHVHIIPKYAKDEGFSFSSKNSLNEKDLNKTLEKILKA